MYKLHLMVVIIFPKFSIKYFLLSNLQNKNMPKTKEVILTLAIVVVLNLFINYGVYTFYKPPALDKFCPIELNQKAYPDKQSCDAVEGRWFENNVQTDYEGRPILIKPESPDGKTNVSGWCDPMAKCRESFDSASGVYNRNVFVMLVITGLISLGLGFAITKSSAVANGFLGGGLLSLIVGTIRYWSDMNDYLRFIILGIALAILIYLGYKKIKN